MDSEVVAILELISSPINDHSVAVMSGCQLTIRAAPARYLASQPKPLWSRASGLPFRVATLISRSVSCKVDRLALKNPPALQQLSKTSPPRFGHQASASGRCGT